MKITKDTKENIVLVAIIAVIVYLLLWITYPRDVNQPLPDPVDTPQTTTSEDTPQNNENAIPIPGSN